MTIDASKLKMNPITLQAIRFCQEAGHSFAKFQARDWRALGEGYEYDITCEDVKN